MASPRPHLQRLPFLLVDLALTPFLPAPGVKTVPGGGKQPRSLLTIFLGAGQD
jgi:hypothetical protein